MSGDSDDFDEDGLDEPRFRLRDIREFEASLLLISRGRLQRPTDTERGSLTLPEYTKRRIPSDEFHAALREVRDMTEDERGILVRRGINAYDA